MSHLSPLARFRAHRATLNPHECWEWQGTTDSAGYGRFYHNGKTLGAHRLAWEIENLQPVPDGMLVCHTCDNRRCVNPNHLFIGTPADNTRDMIEKERLVASCRPGRVVITDEMEAEIVARWKNGEIQKSIAKSLGISRLTVNRICSGWRATR